MKVNDKRITFFIFTIIVSTSISDSSVSRISSSISFSDLLKAFFGHRIAYLKCTLNLNSNSKNEALSLNISRENEGQIWYLRALFWKYF